MDEPFPQGVSKGATAPTQDPAGKPPQPAAGESVAGQAAEDAHAHSEEHHGLVQACKKVALDFVAMRVDKTEVYTRRLMESATLGEIAHVQGEFLRDLMVDYTYGIAQMTYTRAAEALRRDKHASPSGDHP